MKESLEPIEPAISDDYLNSASQVIKELPALENGQTATLKPTALENTPYFLHISVEENTPSKKINTNLSVRMRIVNQSGGGINGEKSGIDLFSSQPEDGDYIEIINAIFNRSHLPDVDEADKVLKEAPIRNVSGIIAPYEDAICLVLAKKTGKNVKMRMNTSLPPHSRTVTQYQKKGYQRTSDNPDRTGTLFKWFPKEMTS